MLVLLPPSETKRDGGDVEPLVLHALAYRTFDAQRSTALAAIADLAGDPEAMMRALKLGPRQASEVDRNRALATAPTMPAMDRYTGVLYDALDSPSLAAEARAYASRHLVIHSALFGLLGAADPIPAYRLSHDSRLPGLRLRALWREPVSSVLAAHDGLIVDLRSEGYAELGPAPRRPDSVFLRVVSVDESGRRRALNHFNKRAKGLFTRALLESRPELETRADLLDWAATSGFRLDLGATRPSAPDELELVA
ncbi:peroxide stress protein YaaA [Agromyces tropicus]|uniref:Peroxide stress protein YaaA n=1 Tax=Agromyces tropicus TaxID=555371 RepID=A0ABN2UP69_9MICO